MIKTFYGVGALDSAGALFTALLIGFFFGLALERAGFGSSRRLSGVFYFRDMAVVKVMFTALITAALGLALVEQTGMIDVVDQIYHMPTFYGAYVIAGLIFGVGFVMSGWCPGTAAVGCASGKLDAFTFLVGGALGSVFFNELFPLIKSLQTWGQSSQNSFGISGLAFVHNSLGITKAGFLLCFSLAAVVFLWVSEFIERRGRAGKGEAEPSSRQPLQTVTAGIIITALVLFVFSSGKMPYESAQTASGSGAAASESFLHQIETAEDHVEPETLAAALYGGDAGVVAVDVRPPEEFAAFHIRGAVNVVLSDLPRYVAGQQHKRMLVLYSNGMTHPAQARDELFRLGYRNVYILTDGLAGFRETCLKPVSLRASPTTPDEAARIRAWREYFLTAPPLKETMKAVVDETVTLPGPVTTAWLRDQLQRARLKIIDCRDQNDYNRSHIPGAVAVSCESFRGAVNGVPSVLLPASLLAQKMSLLNIAPQDTVVLVYGGDRLRDATLIGMAFERLGHGRYGILKGGMDQWVKEQLPTSTQLPEAGQTDYPMPATADSFTVDWRQTAEHMKRQSAVILDVRPAAYFSGEKSDEARAGHIPGALNREYKIDIQTEGGVSWFKPVPELAAAYTDLIPSKKDLVIVHCRTGHQASQTYFVLRHLLGYHHVKWYDAGWTEWATRSELPAETGLIGRK